MLRSTILAVSLAFTASTVAADGSPAKEDGTNAQGSNVGVASSLRTANGHIIGQGEGGADQTTGPGTRADEVQSLQVAEGRGRDAAK